MTDRQYRIFTRWNAFALVWVLAILNPRTLWADPISAFFAAHAIWASIIMSAATTVASIGLNMLFRPKPKPFDKNKLQGDIQLSNVGEDIPITEIYGGRQSDGIGGVKVGGTIIWASQITREEVEVQGGGGGKGGPRAPVGKEFHYYQDFAVLVGHGPLNVQQIKANTDVIFTDFSVGGFPSGEKYEAETDAVLSGGAVEVVDAECSGGKGVNGGGTILFDQVLESEFAHLTKVYFSYKNSADDSATVTLNGDPVGQVALPNSHGDVRNVMSAIALDPSQLNEIQISGLDPATILDCIHVSYSIEPPDICPKPPCQGCFISGAKNPNYTSANVTFDNTTLELSGAPGVPCEQYNYQPNADADGVLELEVAGADRITIYSGTATQNPDPLLEAYFNGIYGVGSAPAYRGRCVVVFERFETTKYGGNIPNLTFLVEHAQARDLGAMYAIRAEKAGLDPAEYDFSAFDDIPLRGYAITARQAPKREMEILNRIFDVDIIQSAEGVITGVVPDYSVVATIPKEELDVREMSSSAPVQGDGDTPPILIERTVADEKELPYFLDVSFINPAKDNDTGNVHAMRTATASSKKDGIETGLVMLESEAQRFAIRELQRIHAEKDAMAIKTFWKHCLLEPAQVIEIEELDGGYSKMRIASVSGLIPSVYEVAGVSRDVEELAPRPYEVAPVGRELNDIVAPFEPPALVIGTLIDLMNFRTGETVPGVYAAACLYDSHYKWKGTTLSWERESGWERLDVLDKQATMGTVVSGAADVPGGWAPGDWDDDTTLVVDLLFGDLEGLSDDEVLDQRNIAVWGDEVIAFGTATRVDDETYDNRWELTHLRRRVGGTDSSGHTDPERFVLMNSAVKYVPLDISEADGTRNYGFLTGGQDPADCFTTSFTWDGPTKYRTPAYDTIDAQAPVVTEPPVIYNQDDPLNTGWMILWQKPDEYGFWADNVELRFVADLMIPLGTDIDADDTSFDHAEIPPESNVVLFPDGPGILLIEDEMIEYASFDGTTFTGCTRGAYGTIAVAHTGGPEMRFIAKVLKLGNISFKLEPKFGFDCLIAYRWRNRNRTQSDGWSNWSPQASAYSTSNATQNPPYSELVEFDNDPPDVSAPDTAKTVWRGENIL